MKIEPHEIDSFLTYAVTNLLDAAEEFIYQKSSKQRTVNINRQGQLYYEINTSCSCHPEMQTVFVDQKEFVKWLLDKNKDISWYVTDKI